jgi:hypothetical protein
MHTGMESPLKEAMEGSTKEENRVGTSCGVLTTPKRG